MVWIKQKVQGNRELFLNHYSVSVMSAFVLPRFPQSLKPNPLIHKSYKLLLITKIGLFRVQTNTKNCMQLAILCSIFFRPFILCQNMMTVSYDWHQWPKINNTGAIKSGASEGVKYWGGQSNNQNACLHFFLYNFLPKG